MTEKSIYLLNFLAIAGTGMNAGVFMAFSTFVMPALARLEAANGINTMQSINITVITPLFMAILFGTALLCAAIRVHAWRNWENSQSTTLLMAAGLYLIGTIAVTMFANVPLNDQLAGLDQNSNQSAIFWRDFLTRWMWWNHIRGLASAAACFLFIRTISS